MPYIISQIFEQPTITTWRQRINWQPLVRRSGRRPGRVEYENRGIIWEQIEVTPEYFRNQGINSGEANTNSNADVDAQQSVDDEIDMNVNVNANADAGTGSDNHADDEGSDEGSEPSVVAMDGEIIHGAAEGHLEECWSHGSGSSQNGNDDDDTTNANANRNTSGRENNSAVKINGQANDPTVYTNGHNWERSPSPQGLMPLFPERLNRSSVSVGSTVNMISGIVAADHDATTEVPGGRYPEAPTPQGYMSVSPETLARPITIDNSPSVNDRPIHYYASDGLPPTPGVWMSSPVGDDAATEAQGSRLPHAPTPHMSLSPEAPARMVTTNGSPIGTQIARNNLMNGPVGSRPPTPGFSMSSPASVGERSTPTMFTPQNTPASPGLSSLPVAIDGFSTQPPTRDIAHTSALGASPRALTTHLTELSASVENEPEPVSAGLPPDAAGLASGTGIEHKSESDEDPVPSKKRAASAPAEPLSRSIRKRARTNRMLNGGS